MSEPTPLRSIASWMADYLDPDRVDDYCPNGVQVEASSAIRKVAVGVTANLALIDAAIEANADLLVVHHGIYWKGAPYTVTGAIGARIRRLIASQLSLIGYHLPLDGHLEVGNAASMARHLGLVDIAPAFVHRGITAGVIARFPSPQSPADVHDRLRHSVSDRTLFFSRDERAISTVGIVTGGAPRDVHEAIEAGLDLYITGEAGEPSQATAAEEGIHFAACGHHRTERFGPMALAQRLADEFDGLDVTFIDVDNPA